MTQQDSLHRRAQVFFRSIAKDTRLLTSNYVLAETITWLTYHRARSGALTLWRLIADSERAGLLGVEWVTPAVQSQAWDLFQRYEDQVFSFCDYTSFALCFSRPIDFVFGFDSDFRRVGLDLRPGA